MLLPFNSIRPSCAHDVYVADSAEVIGNVVLKEGVSVWPKAVIRGDVNKIRIGLNTNIQDGSILHVTHDGPYAPGGYPLTLENDVTVGHGVVLHGCHVGPLCLIGVRSVVLDGAQLEGELMLGAGSLVPPGKVLKKGWLYFGQPVRAIRKLTDQEIQQLRYSARHYVELATQTKTTLQGA